MTLLPFILPPGFVPLVKEEQKIKEGEPLAQNSAASEVSINIAQDLGISIRKVRTVLRKYPGDEVREGDVLAEKKGIMGGKLIKSTIRGVISKIDEETGSILVKTGASGDAQDKIYCPVDGIVTMVSEGKILVKTDKEALVGDRASGTTYSGEIEKLKSQELRDLGSSIEGKVVVVDKIGREDLAKLLALGVGAVVAVEVDEAVFSNLESKSIETPVIRVKEKDMDAFLKSSKKILVDGEKGVVMKL